VTPVAGLAARAAPIRDAARMDLEGKAALVTGGASGLGRATCEALGARGVRVLVADVDEAGARETAGLVGGEAIAADVARMEDNVAMVQAARERFGRLDLLYLNAGVSSGMGVDESFDLERYRRIMGINLDGVVFGTHAALDLLAADGGGAIVATASLAGLTAVPYDPLYAANKHAVVGLARSLGPALAERGVRFNAVCPGFADTPIIDDIREGLAQTGVPVIPPQAVADAVVRLFAGDMTGECWFVQAGRESGPFRFRGIPGPRAGQPDG
jgi:NAD(P)-dependent dehydrogenase (short-subunit alcohol dehydrogenase family)